MDMTNGALSTADMFMVMNMCEELEAYRALGTVEDFTRALELLNLEQENRLIICDKPKTDREYTQEKYCNFAHRTADGKCEGLAKSDFDDEPPTMCKICKEYYLYDESEELQ